MGTIRVIGLAGRSPDDDWATLLGERRVIARHAGHARRVIPDSFDIDESFDSLFDDDLAGVAERIARGVGNAAERDDFAFLVPGFGSVGDHVVEQLIGSSGLEIVAGRLSSTQAEIGHVQCVDALLLASAQAQRPFDLGLTPVDPALPLIVTNWYGRSVIERATPRLCEMYSLEQIPEPDADGLLYIPARGYLNAPPSFSALQQVVARLRRPDGCPWDREQTARSLLPKLIEEADELREAIEAGHTSEIVDEIGDVLVNLLLQAQIAYEQGRFSMDDVISHATAKLVRRHPHVFAGVAVESVEDVLAIWQDVKAQERHHAGARVENAQQR